MRSYLNTKKKKINKNTTSSSKQLSYETFLHKTNNLRPLWNRLVVETSRPNRPKKKSVRACAMGSAMPIRIGVRSLRMLIGAINAANKSLRRRSSLASCRYSKIRPADNYSADGTVVYIDISIRSQSLKLVSFCFCALCIVETAPGSVLKASVWMLCFYGWTAY